MDIVAQTVIEHFAAENADLREANRQLVDLVADLAFDLQIAKTFAEREFTARVRAERRDARRHNDMASQEAA